MLAILILLVSGSLIVPCQAARILLMPGDHPAHVNYFSVAGGTLKEKGHEIYVLANSRHEKLLSKYGHTNILLTLENVTTFTKDYKKLEDSLFGKSSVFMKTMNFMASFASDYESGCHEILGNEKAMNQIKDLQFDFALIDSMDIMRCQYVIPYKHDIKYISINIRADPWSVRVSALPSVEGMWGLILLDGDSTFIQRLVNTVVYVLNSVMAQFIVDDTLITQYAPSKPITTINDLYLKSEMWLINAENVCLDFPRVSAPHYQFIGGLGSNIPQALPKDFEDFMKSASDGVVVVTFGSAIKRAPPEMLKKMFAAFSQIKQKVVMRYDGDKPESIPANVKLSKWLPQNDLLGHPKTRLFITHGGNSGQLEALFHGVPFVVMPFWGDQWLNAYRAELRQYGQKLDPLNFQSEELLDVINEVLDNPVYGNNIGRCSKIYRSLPSAQESIAFWVDHVLQFGGSHLKPTYLHMPLWKFFMLDILALLMVVLLLSAMLTYLCISFMYRKCCSSKEKVKVQ